MTGNNTGKIVNRIACDLKSISAIINLKYSCTLEEFAKDNDIDFNALKNFIRGKSGLSKSSKGQGVAKILLEKKIITKKLYNSIVTTCETAKKEREKEIAKRKKISNLVKIKLNMTVKEYAEAKGLNENSLYSFLCGTGTGTKINSEAYKIRRQLEEDGLL